MGQERKEKNGISTAHESESLRENVTRSIEVPFQHAQPARPRHARVEQRS